MFRTAVYEYSSIAIKRGIDNHASQEIESHLEELDALLDKAGLSWEEYCIKHNVGASGIVIVSGYRCKELNDLIGGYDKSPHIAGYAADVMPSNGNNGEFFKWALEWARSGIEFDEILIEGMPGSQWVHIAVRSYEGNMRMKTMRYESNMLVDETLKSGVYGAERNEPIKLLEDRDDEQLDWTDEEIYNMLPEELDNYEPEGDEPHGGFLLMHSGGVSEAEKRCLYIMRVIMSKIFVSPKQAAGIVGNIAYMTNGCFGTYKHSDNTYGICKWGLKDRDTFNKLHYRICLIEESSLKDQAEFLAYTMSERLITKLQRCYDENSSCNLFYASYLRKTTWPELFKDLDHDSEESLREELAKRRAFSNAVLELWEAHSGVNVDDLWKYKGNGQDGPRVKAGDDTKTYVSDGEFNEVPEDEREFSRVYTGLEDDPDPELIAYYENLFDTMMS